MNQPRETIYAALFGEVSKLTGIVTSGRRLQPWSKVSGQPAVFQTQITEQPSYGPQGGMPAKWTLRAKWWIYVNTPANAPPPCEQMNGLIDQIEKLFPAEDYRWNTLSGLVNRVRIDGVIKTDEGMLTSQAIAIVPLEIIAT